MTAPFNLPPGCTLADIDRGAGAEPAEFTASFTLPPTADIYDIAALADIWGRPRLTRRSWHFERELETDTRDPWLYLYKCGLLDDTGAALGHATRDLIEADIEIIEH